MDKTIFLSLNRISLKYFKKVTLYDKRKKNNLSLKEYLKKYRIPYIISQFNNFSLEELNIAVKAIKEQKILKEDYIKTFYKKLSKILNSSREELLIDQITHYITTYGKAGYKNKANMYHLNKKLNKEEKEKVKKLIKDIKIIETMFLSEAIGKIKELINKDIAIESEDVKEIFKILYYFGSLNQVETKNKELKYYINLVNKSLDFEDIGRLLNHIFTSTKKPLFIKTKDLKEDFYFTKKEIVLKNTKLSDFLKVGDSKENLYNILRESFLSLNKKELAKRFNRDKMLFMVIKDIFKEDKEIRKSINKISKLSKKFHQPLKRKELISEKVTPLEFEKEIKKKKTTELIKIANALKIRIEASKKLLKEVPLFVVIRNGKRYYTTTSLPKKYLDDKFEIIKSILRDRIIQNMKKYNISIEKNELIKLAIPFSQKKFVYTYPVGTKININKKNLIIGISWKGKNVDFDLSVISANKKIGWNSFYKKDGIFFSGDITSAPFGATELIWIRKPNKIGNLFKVNVHLFSSPENKSKFKFFIGVANENIKKKDFNNPIEKIVSIDNILFANTFLLEKRNSVELGVLLKGFFYFVNFKGKTGVTNLISVDEEEALELYVKSFVSFDEILNEEDYKTLSSNENIINPMSPNIDLLLKAIS